MEYRELGLGLGAALCPRSCFEISGIRRLLRRKVAGIRASTAKQGRAWLAVLLPAEWCSVSGGRADATRRFVLREMRESRAIVDQPTSLGEDWAFMLRDWDGMWKFRVSGDAHAITAMGRLTGNDLRHCGYPGT